MTVLTPLDDRQRRAALAAHAPMLRRYVFVLGVRADRVDDADLEGLRNARSPRHLALQGR